MEPFLYTPIGFLFFELIRLYERVKKKEPYIFPREPDYYIFMAIILLVISVIAYGIDIRPVVAALLFGYSLPSGLKDALRVAHINSGTRNDNIDDIGPDTPTTTRNPIYLISSRYFDV